MGKIVFYDWPHSPFCMKVQAILDYKHLKYECVNPLSARGTLNRRGTGKVPAIDIDGHFITDSTDIASALFLLGHIRPSGKSSMSRRLHCAQFALLSLQF